MAAYEAGAYTVTDFAKRMEPLRRTEADLVAKKKEAERQLDQQAAIIAEPATVLEFARQVGEFIKHSTPKQRKQVLKRFVKCVWIEPGKDKKEQARAKILYRVPLPRDAGKSKNSEREPALGEEPVTPSTLFGPNRRWPKPTLPTGPRSQHPPRSPAAEGTGPTAWPTPAWCRLGPECWRREPPPPAAIPWCPPRCAAWVPVDLWLLPERLDRSRTDQ